MVSNDITTKNEVWTYYLRQHKSWQFESEHSLHFCCWIKWLWTTRKNLFWLLTISGVSHYFGVWKWFSTLHRRSGMVRTFITFPLSYEIIRTLKASSYWKRSVDRFRIECFQSLRVCISTALSSKEPYSLLKQLIKSCYHLPSKQILVYRKYGRGFSSNGNRFGTDDKYTNLFHRRGNVSLQEMKKSLGKP